MLKITSRLFRGVSIGPWRATRRWCKRFYYGAGVHRDICQSLAIACWRERLTSTRQRNHVGVPQNKLFKPFNTPCGGVLQFLECDICRRKTIRGYHISAVLCARRLRIRRARGSSSACLPELLITLQLCVQADIVFARIHKQLKWPMSSACLALPQYVRTC